MPHSRQIKAQARLRISQTKPSPFFVGFVFVILIYAIQMVVRQMNLGPVFFDLNAAQAGDVANVYTYDTSNFTFFSTLLLLAFQVIMILLDFGVRFYSLDVWREAPTSVSCLFDGFANFVRCVLLWLCKNVILSVLFMAFIVPGVIGFYSYRQAELLLADHPEWGPMRCLRESRQLMKGHKMEMFKLDISMLHLYILSCFVVAKVFTDPYINVAKAEFFDIISGHVPPLDDDKSNQDWVGDQSDKNSDRKPWEY